MAIKIKRLDSAVVRQAFDYDPETGSLRWAAHRARAGKEAGHVHVCTAGKTYVQVRLDDSLHYAHRIAWTIVHGEIPEGMQIDHIDGDGANNKRANLRMASATDNKRNMRKFVTNTSGVTGVHRAKGKFSARVWFDGKTVSLGTYSTLEEASSARSAYNRRNDFHENHGQDRPL